MAIARSNHLGKNILKLFGIEDTDIVEAHIHMVRNDIIIVDIKRYATQENGDFVLTKDKKEIVTELKKYHLVEIKEEECKK